MNGCNHVQIERGINKDLLLVYLFVLSMQKMSLESTVTMVH